MEMKTIVFVGNALVDFAVKCENTFLLGKYDLEIDHQYECNKSQVALFDDILQMGNVSKIPGGSAQNSARICAAISKQDKRLSTNVFMIASIGNDENGRYLSHFMHDCGVIPLYQKSKTGNPTGTTAALVTDDGSRTLVANIAASADLNESALSFIETQEALRRSGIIFIEGYILTNCSSVAFKLAQFASNSKKVFSFGISATFVVQERLSDILKLLPLCDILFGNLDEARELAKHIMGQDQNASSSSDAVKNIIVKSSKKTEISLIEGINQLVIITNGSGPVIVGMHLRDGSVDILEFEVDPTKVTGDAIGAGDTFAAGVLMALLSNLSVEESIAMGNKYSAQCLKHTGCFIDE